MHTLLACLPAMLAPLSAPDGCLSTPIAKQTFETDGATEWALEGSAPPGLIMNDHYIAPPAPGQPWEAWYGALDAYRAAPRASLNDPLAWRVDVRYDGVRAWVRAGRDWAHAARLRPGERVRIEGEGRWLEGNDEICLAFDLCDRSGESGGAWRGWSTVLATTRVPRDGAWHAFGIEASVPDHDAEAVWMRPILGQDGTHDAAPGRLSLRSLRLAVPSTPEREDAWSRLADALPHPSTFDDSLYRRDDLTWTQSNFACGFVFVYDGTFWDPEARRYRVRELCADARRRFGGYDSVVLWHAYPRIGADARNQFDFWRDMPGGLAGLRQAVDQFHAEGVRVFVPYKPWDVGTRREGRPDDEALADVVGAIGADGVFLDTMSAAPGRMRALMDAARPGVAFEPEGHPETAELQVCSSSWAQWLAEFPGVGVLRHKWVEPRHMQHQIRRWDRRHEGELRAAWLNGGGIMVWENVFGSLNPWHPEDAATLRRMAPVLRAFSGLLSDGEWLPYVPTERDGAAASCWREGETRLWLIANLGETEVRGTVIPPVEGVRAFDLWSGRELAADWAIELKPGGLGAVFAAPEQALPPDLPYLLTGQARSAALRAEDEHPTPPIAVVAPPAVPVSRPETREAMLPVAGGECTFHVSHQRRECGCYPDPGAPEERWSEWLSGTPWDGTIEHNVTTVVEDCLIDARPVTNAEYAEFLERSGYRPERGARFLDHWGGAAPPEAIRDEPVVYVTLDDARAYAAWAGKRLPTEWEWHRAAEVHGEAFERGRVWELTESERFDGRNRFVMLRGGSAYRAEGSGWYFPGGPQPIETHAKFLLLWEGLDRCSTIGFRCVARGG